MVLILELVVLSVVILLLIIPLSKKNRTIADSIYKNDRSRADSYNLDILSLSIADLEYDYQAGKIEKSDYETIKADLMQESEKLSEKIRNEELEQKTESDFGNGQQFFFCHICGVKVLSSHKFCFSCGTNLESLKKMV